jgi:hypothetical protein
MRPPRPLDRRSFLTGIGMVGAGLLADSSSACGTAASAHVAHLPDLRKVVRGRVLLPGDPGFEQAARPWNLAVTQRVSAVAEVADAADAAALVAFARDAGVAVSVQPSGHGAADDLDGVILVRTGRLTELAIDPGARTARVGAGVGWGRVLSEAGPHGLAGPAGSSPTVNVTGFTLGGGLSWFGRRYGWACDAVTAFDAVDPDGHPRRITAGSDPDLFWAMRGGGGDFALVTAMEFDLFPAPVVFGGRMTWPADRGPEVMAAFRDVTAHAPDELSVWLLRTRAPGAPASVAIAAAYLGDEAEARALLSPFDGIDGRTTDTRRILPLAELGEITSESTKPGPAISRSEFLTDIDDAAAQVLLQPTAPLTAVEIRHLGGAWTRPSGSAAGPLSARYCLVTVGIAPTPESVAAVDTRFQQLTAALHPVLAGRKAFTFLGPGDVAEQAFTPASIAQLRDIKRRRDPKAVIRGNFPVLG